MNRTDESILDILRRGEGFVSGESICSGLAVTRAAVWKHIKSLRELGYEIESSPGSGYRLVSAPDMPFPCEINNYLTTRVLGRQATFVSHTDSTNRQMGALARDGAPEGALLVADHQTRGRGRMQRSWFSPAGVNLYFSLLLRPSVAPSLAPQLSLVAGLALCRAVERCCPLANAQIKWPNDVYLEGRKLSGILCDMAAEADRIHHLVVGVGINVNVQQTSFPADIAEKAISLLTISGAPLSRSKLLADFLNILEPVYRQWLDSGLSGLLSDLEQRSFQKGKTVMVDLGREKITGTALGFSTGGGLKVRARDGQVRTIVCGDVLIAT